MWVTVTVDPALLVIVYGVTLAAFGMHSLSDQLFHLKAQCSSNTMIISEIESMNSFVSACLKSISSVLSFFNDLL